jgi:NADPH-dependent glutamate synthase beta subunit-like oxidoreductase
MGPWAGGQAELLRVPWGDFNCLRLGEDAEERQADYVMLADIFPTGYHATEMANVRPGDQTVIYGAGPVGCTAAYSAIIKGAGKVMVVDRHRPGSSATNCPWTGRPRATSTSTSVTRGGRRLFCTRTAYRRECDTAAVAATWRCWGSVV